MSWLRALSEAARAAALEVVRPGEPRLPGPALERVGRVVLTLVIVLTNIIGACSVLPIALFVVPMPAVGHAGHVRLVNAVAAAVYLALAVVTGVVAGSRGMRPLREWLLEERQATVEETRIVLQAPLRLFALQLGLWLVAAAAFGILNSIYSSLLALRVAAIIVLAGLVTATCAYLLIELILRPAAARALVDAEPGRLRGPGVATRAVLAWAFGTGLPLLGVVGVGVLALADDHSGSPHQLGTAMVVLGGVGILVGFLSVGLVARATADPVDSVRRALAKVREGDFDQRVPVYDATQIGQLQLGFNSMVSGLAERERIRQAFGTYVDPDVAERVLEEGTSLEGEEVEVTLMFIDVRDFTGFAERNDAVKVVAALNQLFEQIVPVVHEHGGRVDKFVGDGLLAVFGAPNRQADHADQALAAARDLEKRLSDGDSELEVGIGLNSGTVVSGNVGGAGRLEFSVIGDAVNIAARVEEATRETGDAILLTEDTKRLLKSNDIALTERQGIELKGKRESVCLYALEAT